MSSADIDEVLAPHPSAEPSHKGETANGHGASTNGNGASANGNGASTNGNGVAANGNGVAANGNGASANGNESHAAESSEAAPERYTGEDPAAAQTKYVASLELRLAELVQIEKVRDLEIHHLEAELGQHADRAFELETALFHSERRAKDLERRWQELADVYETVAAALVVAGGQLEEIHHQPAYRIVLRVSGAIRRYPRLYALLRGRFHHRAAN